MDPCQFARSTIPLHHESYGPIQTEGLRDANKAKLVGLLSYIKLFFLGWSPVLTRACFLKSSIYQQAHLNLLLIWLSALRYL